MKKLSGTDLDNYALTMCNLERAIDNDTGQLESDDKFKERIKRKLSQETTDEKITQVTQRPPRQINIDIKPTFK